MAALPYSFRKKKKHAGENVPPTARMSPFALDFVEMIMTLAEEEKLHLNYSRHCIGPEDFSGEDPPGVPSLSFGPHRISDVAGLLGCYYYSPQRIVCAFLMAHLPFDDYSEKEELR